MEKLPQLIWNEHEEFEAQVKYLVEEEKVSEEEARERTSEENDYITFAWEDLLGCLDEHLNEINPDGLKWKGRVENFGWRGQSGYSNFSAENSQEFLQNILPKTNCTFHIWVDKDKKEIRIRNWHHDSPIGKEWYHICPELLCNECI